MTEKRERVTYKLIFLDIDGVLNTAFIHHGIWKELAFRLADLVKAIGASIVLSSQWRLHPESREEVKKTFLQVGLPMPLSCTPLLSGISFKRKRLREITGWLKRNTTNIYQEGEDGIPSSDEFLELEGAFHHSDFTLPKKITVSHFVAFDDIDMSLEKYGGKNRRILTDSHFVKTLPRIGLSENNVLEAMVLLGKSQNSIRGMKCDYCSDARKKTSLHHPYYNKHFCSLKCQENFIHVEIPFMSTSSSTLLLKNEK